MQQWKGATSPEYPKLPGKLTSKPGPPTQWRILRTATKIGAISEHTLQVQDCSPQHQRLTRCFQWIDSQNGNFASSSAVFALSLGIICLEKIRIFLPSGFAWSRGTLKKRSTTFRPSNGVVELVKTWVQEQEVCTFDAVSFQISCGRHVYCSKSRY